MDAELMQQQLPIRRIKTFYEPALSRAIRAPLTFIGGALILLVMAGLLFTQLGQVFIPTLDEKNIAMNALRIPSTAISAEQEQRIGFSL
jgi:heavy metal efflux system protein